MKEELRKRLFSERKGYEPNGMNTFQAGATGNTCYGMCSYSRHGWTNKETEMRILRIINNLNIGGAERGIVGNIPVHIKNGYDIDVLLLDGKDTFFLSELQEHGVVVKFLGKNNNIYNPLLILKLFKYMNEYDLIHVHLFPSLYWVAFAKMFSHSKTRLIFTEHSTDNRRMKKWYFNPIDRVVYRQYETIVAISDSTKKVLAGHLGDQTNIVTINNGVDISKVREEGRIELNEFASKYVGRKILLQVANFHEAKDQDTLIRALPLLSDDYVAIFIGDGKRRAYCEELGSQLNVQDRIEFVGLQSNVGAFINLAKAVVMSSHVEGFGRAAVEGMALGKPVIASNVPGLADVVRGAGLLFEVGDYRKLAEHILSLSNDREYYDQIAEKCLERASMFDIDNMVKQYEDIYDGMIKER